MTTRDKTVVGRAALAAAVVAGVGTVAPPLSSARTVPTWELQDETADAPEYCYGQPASETGPAIGECFDQFSELLVALNYSNVPTDLAPDDRWLAVAPFDLADSATLPGDRPIEAFATSDWDPARTQFILHDDASEYTDYFAAVSLGHNPDNTCASGEGLGELSTWGWNDRADSIYWVQCQSGKFYADADWSTASGSSPFSKPAHSFTTNLPSEWRNRISSFRYYP